MILPFILFSLLPSGYTRAGRDFGTEPGKIAIIPDIHADPENLIISLWTAAKSVENTDLSLYQFTKSVEQAIAGRVVTVLFPGSTTRLIQLGDVNDRGHNSIKCYNIMRVIDRVTGWHVVQLLGNHDIFAGRPEYFHYVSLRDLYNMNWIQGFIDSFAIGSPLWEQISDSQTIHIAGDTLFVHGGVNLDWFGIDDSADVSNKTINVTALNTLISTQLRTDGESLLGLPISPVMDRALSTLPEPMVCGDYLQRILTLFNVKRIVVGHTPQLDQRVKTRCGGQVVLSDVMISRGFGFGGQPVAVVLDPDTERMNAHYYKSAWFGWQEWIETETVIPIENP